MADTFDDVVPLPPELSGCGCRFAPSHHSTTCAVAIAFDETPLRERPEYVEVDGRSNRFASISWDFPLRVEGSIAVEVELDPEAIIRDRMAEYQAFEMDDEYAEYAEWEKPMAFLLRLVEDQLEVSVWFGRRQSRDHSFVEELRGLWTGEQTRALFERLRDTTPVVDPNQTQLDV